MGCGVSTSVGCCADKKYSLASKLIDAELSKDRRYQQRVIKLLLLGPAATGKSTVLKQMRILHTSGFRQEEFDQYRVLVRKNVISTISAVLKKMRPQDELIFLNPEREAAIDTLEQFLSQSDDGFVEISAQILKLVRELWKEADLQDYARTCVRTGCDIVTDSDLYFLDHIDRITTADYKPSQQDILYLRVPTTGIVDMGFTIQGVFFRVFDVGGQRSERRKWLHCFDHVIAVIFIASLSAYNETIAEDRVTNGMKEAFMLFEAVINSIYFLKLNFILFLNKIDLFQTKIKLASITLAFPLYAGPQTYEDCLVFIERSFREANTNHKREIYCHRTCSTDTNQIEIVLDNTLDTVIKSNLDRSGLVT